MSTIVRFLVGGIAVTYLVCIAAQFARPDFTLSSNQAFGVAVLLFAVVAVALHVALVVSMRSWSAAILAVASVAVFAVLFLRALMKVTGDSL
jgi:apolipoprotein N-acyltransferase